MIKNSNFLLLIKQEKVRYCDPAFPEGNKYEILVKVLYPTEFHHRGITVLPEGDRKFYIWITLLFYMNISLVQYSPVWEDKKSNRDKLSNVVNNSGNTDLLLFPEMTLTGFTMKSNLFFEELQGESLQFFSTVALSKKSFVAAGIIEREGEQYFNTLLIINKGGKLISKYRKIHPFSYSSENEHYTGGTQPVIVDIEGWQTGLSICYDLRFPELYRIYGKKRASLIINIANWPDTRIHHWSALLKARAIENQCYIAAVNRVGEKQKLNYPGSSAVYDPMGNEIVKCGNRDGVFSAEIFMEQVESTRLKFPFLNDIKLL